MNLPELLISLCGNTLYPLKLIGKKYHISLSQLLCIHSIPIDGVTQTQLADLLSLDVSTLSRNLDKLEMKDIIVKQSVKHDNRFCKIFLTKYGQELFQNILADFTKYIRGLSLSNSNIEIQLIIDSLENLNWNILKTKSNNV